MKYLAFILLLLAGCVSASAGRGGLDAIAARLCPAPARDRREGIRLYRRLLRPARMAGRGEADAQDPARACGPGRGAAAPAWPRSHPAALDPIDSRRRDFLLAQLKAAATRLRMIQGEKLSFADEAEGLFGGPARAEAALDLRSRAGADRDPAARHRVRSGSAMDAFQNRFVVPKDRLDAVMRAAIAECRRRTVGAYRPARQRALHPRIRHRQELGRL